MKVFISDAYTEQNAANVELHERTVCHRFHGVLWGFDEVAEEAHDFAEYEILTFVGWAILFFKEENAVFCFPCKV